MNVVRIGFSGSRGGMTDYQIRAVYDYLSYVGVTNDNYADGIEAHHGDCIGADRDFHVLVTALGWKTVAHPPDNPSKRAYCHASVILEPKPYLVRDLDIVQVTGELVATPDGYSPRSGSGTWATVAMAVREQRPSKVCLPDGTWKVGNEFLFLRAGSR